MKRALQIALTALLLAPTLVHPATATFPGTNGRILVTTAPEFESGSMVNLRRKLKSIDPVDASAALVSTDRLIGEAAWSPDGSKIAVSRATDASFNARTQIWVMNADGSDLRALTPVTRKSDNSPAWSPDGSKIVYQRARTYFWPNHYYPQLYVMNADGTDRRPLTDGGKTAFEWPDWSPDGSKILATRSRGQQDPQLVTIDPDSGAILVRVTSGPTWHWEGSWSPDGSKIAYGRGWEGGIGISNADGTGEIIVTTPGPSENDFAPTWSPDGTMFAFQRVNQTLFRSHGTVWTAHVDGSSPTMLAGKPGTTDAYIQDWQTT